MTERQLKRYLPFCAAALLALTPEIASANILDNFGTAMLNVLNNNFLRAVATIAVIGAGIMALTGRVQWMIFITILLAVVIIFGASGIVQYIQDNASVSALAPAEIFALVV